MSIESKLEELKEELALFEDEIDKYEYIIEIGKKSQPMDDKYKIKENIIQGCTSKVWLIREEESDKLVFKTDSETVIVKGLAKIVQDIFSNQSSKEIQEFDTNLLSDLGITQIITPSRQNGVANMIKRIKKYAKLDMKEKSL